MADKIPLKAKFDLDGNAVALAEFEPGDTITATLISEDTTHRFATDAEKTSWNSKEVGGAAAAAQAAAALDATAKANAAQAAAIATSSADATAKVAAHEALPDPHSQYATGSALSDHTGSTANPHSVTKAQVGLGSVDNVSAASLRDRTTHTGEQAISTVTGLSGALAGKADLVGGVVPSSQLPSYVDDVLEVANLAALPGTGETGKIYVTLSDNNSWRWTGSTYQKVSQPLDEMPQAVAEVGTSETLYAATSRRIRQAIAAWFSGITHIDGKIIGATTPAAGSFTSLSATGALTTAGIKEDAAGNVGIGVMPSAWDSSIKAIQAGDSSIAGQTGGSLWLGRNCHVASGGVSVYKNSGTADQILIDASGFKFKTAPYGAAGDPITFIQTMTLDAYGNLLVGATSPVVGEKVTITQPANSTGLLVISPAADRTAINFYSALTGSNHAAAMHFAAYSSAGANIVFFVKANGDVINLNNSYGAISDIKLKQDITDCTPKLDKLKQVRIVNYRLKSNPEHKQLGVIAQELEQIFPGMIEESPDYIEVKKTREVEVPAVTEERLVTEAVFDDGDQIAPAVYETVEVFPATTKTEEYIEREATGEFTKSVKYSVFVPMLIKAMQEQSEIIDKQAEMLAAFESRLAALEAA